MAKRGPNKGHELDQRSAAAGTMPGQESAEGSVPATPDPGLSPNPATNLIIQDILLRSAGRLSRVAVEKAVLGRQYGKQYAEEAVENRGVLSTLAAYGVTKLATKSVPGAVAVGAGLFVKVLFDRSQSRRKARRQRAREMSRPATRKAKN